MGEEWTAECGMLDGDEWEIGPRILNPHLFNRSWESARDSLRLDLAMHLTDECLDCRVRAFDLLLELKNATPGEPIWVQHDGYDYVVRPVPASGETSEQ